MDELSTYRRSKREYRLLQLRQLFLVDATEGGSVLTWGKTKVTVLNNVCIASQNCHCFFDIGKALDLVESLSDPKDERCECTGPTARYPAKCKGRRRFVIKKKVIELVAYIANGIQFGLIRRETSGDGSDAPADGTIKACVVLALVFVLAPVRLLAGRRTVVLLMTSGASSQNWFVIVNFSTRRHVELKGVCADVQTLLAAGGTSIGASLLSLRRRPFFRNISSTTTVYQILAKTILKRCLEDLVELADGVNVPRGIHPLRVVVEQITVMTAGIILVRLAIKDANGDGMLLDVNHDTNLDDTTAAAGGGIIPRGKRSRPLVAWHLLLHCNHGSRKVHPPGLRVDPVHGAVPMAGSRRLDLERAEGRQL